jgi:CheY-like chemotaxis protein
VAVITTVDDRAKGFSLGADAYDVKPIDRQTLLQTLTRLVEPERVRRVLLVDDEEISRYVLRQYLTAATHIVTEAVSGAEALSRVRAERPDVICLDLGLPDVDGYEVLRRLRADPRTEQIPVVIVTSTHLEEHERRSLLEQATSILAKDRITREEVTAAVEGALERPERARP